MIAKIIFRDVTIANGATDSTDVDLWRCQLIAIRTPANLRGVTSVNIHTAPVTVSDGPNSQYGTFMPVYKSDGNLFTVTLGGTSRHLAFNATDTMSLQSAKFIANTAASGGDLQLTLVLLSDNS